VASLSARLSPSLPNSARFPRKSAIAFTGPIRPQAQATNAMGLAAKHADDPGKSHFVVDRTVHRAYGKSVVDELTESA